MNGHTAPAEIVRRQVDVDGVRVSCLHGGRGAPLPLFHDTFWSRVWEPMLPVVAGAGREVLAVDFPSFGHSEGRLTREQVTVPSLADWATRFLGAVGVNGAFSVTGHDIGGAVAQNRATTG